MKLHNIRSEATGYTTWGCMWKQGECNADTDMDNGFVCKNAKGEKLSASDLQSRVTAYWPDGSIKWTAHTADASKIGNEISLELADEIKTTEKFNYDEIKIQEEEKAIVINSTSMSIYITKNSPALFDKAIIDGKEAFVNLKPVLQLEEPTEIKGVSARLTKKYTGIVKSIEIEERGKLQTVIKYQGVHVSDTDGDEKFPFIIRMTVGRDCNELKFMHTFLYDGDENRDYLKGIGLTFETPVRGAMYNRHVKFMNDYGMFHEAVVPLMSWRPRIPENLYESQMKGEQLSLQGTDLETVNKVLQDTPYWSEYVLYQDSVSHFGIKKKMAYDNTCYIDCLNGERTEGGFAFGSEAGSVMMGIRDFWEKYPTGYQLKGMDSDTAECTLWFWSPEAPSMDFRHYANRGYNQVCYEGYDYKGATPVGIACTNECSLTYLDKMIPDDEKITAFTKNVNKPALYVASPEFYHERKAFGYWSLPSRNNEMENWLETQLDNAVGFYENEVSQRGWYGMFNYGDFMHTYDSKRHQWKYDIGGYAWDNTELVPTLWLWYYFMRTGREDVFTLAEKLSRHASEVDVYHFGKYKGLGSRHNVRHWGCPCKEARIAMAAHHRFLYYLTGDRRLEDIFDELKDNEMSFLNRDPLGDFYDKKDMVYPSHARSGPDWSSLCSNWMTQWERTNDTKYRDKITTGIEDIKATPLQLSSGPDFEFDPETVHLRYIGERTTGGCHLQVCMGAPSVWMETADLLGDEDFKRMIANHGRFYYLPHEKQLEESGGIIGDRESTLPFMSAAMGAYGAKYLDDKALAKTTWRILLETLIHDKNHEGFMVKTLKDTGNRSELKEIPWISTNFVAQWCLNVIMVLEFIRDELPESLEEADKLVEGGDTFLFRKA
jgi:hypothetical protein